MKHPHPHHDMIVEWAKDPSRRVELEDSEGVWCYAAVPLEWDPNFEYRFADTVKKEVVSSLTDEEIRASYRPGTIRTIADAAAKREREDIIKWLKTFQEASTIYTVSLLEREL